MLRASSRFTLSPSAMFWKVLLSVVSLIMSKFASLSVFFVIVRHTPFIAMELPILLSLKKFSA